MQMHYFRERYHAKEIVDTANMVFLLSCLYSFSSDKFIIVQGIGLICKE